MGCGIAAQSYCGRYKRRTCILEWIESQEVWGWNIFFFIAAIVYPPSLRLAISTSLPADSDGYQNPSNLTHVVYHHLAPQPPPYHNNNPPLLFSNGLEYLYTGKGFGAEAFEILFDSLEPSSRDHHFRGGMIQTTMQSYEVILLNPDSVMPNYDCNVISVYWYGFIHLLEAYVLYL